MTGDNMQPSDANLAAKAALASAEAKRGAHSTNLLSLAGDFLDSAANSAVERPINALSQLSNHVLGTGFGSMHAFDLKRPANTAETIAQQAGGALGSLAPYMVARTGVRFIAREGIGLSASTSLLNAVGENAASGAAMGFFLSPSAQNSGSGFWASRFKSAAVDGGTFAAMGATQHALGSKFALSAPEQQAMPLSLRMMRSSLMGAVSSAPAGFVNAELQSVADGRGPSSAGQIAGDMAGFAMFGGLLGPLDAFAPTGDRVKPGTDAELDSVYAKRYAYQEALGREAVKHDLSLHRAYDVKAGQLSESVSVLDKLKAAGLDDTQMKRVLTSLAYVREGFAKQRGKDGLIEPDQKGNWLHTLDELDAGLDRTHGQPPAQVEKTLMAMFGDAWKTKFNFTRHNYDGAEVGRIVLSRQTDGRFTAQDVRGIVEANKEHQVSPPGLMGTLYINKIASVLNDERAKEFARLSDANGIWNPDKTEVQRYEELRKLSNEQDHRRLQTSFFEDLKKDGVTMESDEELQYQQLRTRARFGSFISDDEATTLSNLQAKIAKPYEFPLQRTPEGGMAVELTPDEQAMLRIAGIDYWHVPHESTPWFAESRNGVVADILANLGLGGRRKLTGLNGPETDPVFQFGTVRQCVDSGLTTYADIKNILLPEEYQYVQARLGTISGAVDRAMGRVADWLRQDRSLADNPDLKNVPFWDTPLKYPNRGDNEARWWYYNRIPYAKRGSDVQEFWEAHRFDGLNEQEKADYLRAIQIRNRTVEELGKELRLDNQFVPDFQPVMQRKGALGAWDTYKATRQTGTA